MTKSADVNNLIVEKISITMKTSGGYASWINGNNVRHNRSMHNMVREGLIDSNQHEKKWCCAAEKSDELYRCKIHN